MRIPKILHHIWLGSPIPAHLQRCRDTWKRHHPGWVHHIWLDSDLDWLTNRDLFDRAPAIVPPDAVWQFRADIARYEILYRYGGLYVDCDTSALRPIDETLGDHEVWAAAEDRNWVGNTYIGSVPGNPLMADLVAGIPDSVQANARKRPNKMTGPQYITPIWRKHNAHVAPSESFYPYSYSDVKNKTIPTKFGPEVVAVHSWNHTREVLNRRKRA